MKRIRPLRWAISLLLLLSMMLTSGVGWQPSVSSLQAESSQQTMIDKLRSSVEGTHLSAKPSAIDYILPTSTPSSGERSTDLIQEMQGPQSQEVVRTEPDKPLDFLSPSHKKGGSRLTLSAIAGKPGSNVTLYGNNYAPNQRVQIYWDNVDVTGRQLILTDDAGTFSWSFDIPEPMTSGDHTISVMEATTQGASLATQSGLADASSATFNVVGGEKPGAAIAALAPPSVDTPPIVIPDNANATPSAIKPWTFAVYIAGDNDLSKYADLNLDQMIKAGGTTVNANIVALVDKQNSPTKVFEVKSNGLVDKTASMGVTGNIDTGNPQVFISFMEFIAKEYPAEHYATAIWNHGGGWTAVESDDRSGNFWDMSELRQALHSGLQKLGKSQFDLVLFDACLMAQYEVALAIEDLVDVIVASAEIVPGPGTPYHTYLPKLTSNASATAHSFASAIVEDYGVYYSDTSSFGQVKYTMSAINTETPMATFKSQIEAFATALLKAGYKDPGKIQDARNAALRYKDHAFVDLGDFAVEVKARVKDSDVQNAADAIINALKTRKDSLLIKETHSNKIAKSTGLSIYLPSHKDPNSSPWNNKYEQTAVKGTAWYSFVSAFYKGRYPAPTNQPTPTPSPTPSVTTTPPLAPGASSYNDIVFSNRIGSWQFDLARVSSTLSESGEPSGFVTMVHDSYRNAFPRWSPDSQYVVYASDQERREGEVASLASNLYLVNSQGYVNEQAAPHPASLPAVTSIGAPAGTKIDTPTHTPTVTPTTLHSSQQTQEKYSSPTVQQQEVALFDQAPAPQLSEHQDADVHFETFAGSQELQQQGTINLVNNGGFELGDEGWSSTGDATVIESNFTHSGQRHLASDEDSVVWQKMTIPANATSLQVKYWLWIFTLDPPYPDADDGFFVGIADNTFPAETSTIYARTDPVYKTVDESYQYFDMPLDSTKLSQILGKQVTLFFKFIQDESEPVSNMRLDDVSVDVSVTTTTPTPMPTPTEKPPTTTTPTPTPTPTEKPPTTTTPTPTPTPTEKPPTTPQPVPGMGEKPRQLTFSTVNCSHGYGTGATCTVEQSSDPAWLQDGSGILYTKTFIDISDSDTENWKIKKSIWVLDHRKLPTDNEYTFQLLPHPMFTYNEGVLFENADFNGNFLMFHYSVESKARSKYDQQFVDNNIGVIDMTGSELVFRVFVLNDPESSGPRDEYGVPLDFLLTDYPAWRGNSPEMAFLYTRRGNPPVMQNVDPRTPPVTGEWENISETYDIGYLTFGKEDDGKYYYHMKTPIWVFKHAKDGEGVYYRPDWQPGDESSRLTASYSYNGGHSYDIAIFTNVTNSNYQEHTGHRITADGYSYQPSWGIIHEELVKASIELNTDTLLPDEERTFKVRGNGFVPNKPVELVRGFEQNSITAKLKATIVANNAGMFETEIKLSQGTPPGVWYIQGKSTDTNRLSNVVAINVMDSRDVLEHSIGSAGGDVRPGEGLVLFKFKRGDAKDDSVLMFDWKKSDQTTSTFPGNPLYFFDVELHDAQGTAQQPSSPVDVQASYDDGLLAPVNEKNLKFFRFESGQWKALDSQVDTVQKTVSAKLEHFSSYALGEPIVTSNSNVYLPFIQKGKSR